jgi:hypothetical protein
MDLPMLNPIAFNPGEKISVSFDFSKAHLLSGDGGLAVKAGGGLKWRASKK